MKVIPTLVAMGVLLAAMGCGDDTGGSGGSGGAGGGSGGGSTTTTSSGGGEGGGSTTTTTTGAGGEGGGAASLCDTPNPSPNTIGETQMSSAYPTPAGGTIAEGTYYLSAFEIYPDATADANTRANTIDVIGDDIRVTRISNGGAAEVIGGSWTANGSDLTISLSCPASQTITLPFTATATELWLFDPSEPNVQIYTKQ